MSEAERSAYEEHLENLRYQKSVITTGIIEGYMKGLAEGRAEGHAEGEKAKALAAARVLLSKNIAVDIIAAATGLTS